MREHRLDQLLRDSPPRAGSARRPADACRAWGGSRSRSRGGARRSPRTPRPRRSAARTSASTPRRRARAGAATRSSCSGSASPTLCHGSRPWHGYDSARLMQSFVIEGGRPLSGTIRASGNKNGALPILAATVLASEEVLLSNVPRIRDVETMVELLADLGADVDVDGPERGPRRQLAGVSKTELDPELCREIRASFLLAGPLLARFGRVVVPPPGRRRDRPPAPRHAHPRLRRARRRDRDQRRLRPARRAGCVGTRMYLDEASVMGTENAIMAAVLAEGETVVGHAACEPHIQDLCRFLVVARRRDRGDRLERPPHPGRRPARRRRRTASGPTTSRWRASSASRP